MNHWLGMTSLSAQPCPPQTAEVASVDLQRCSPWLVDSPGRLGSLPALLSQAQTQTQPILQHEALPVSSFYLQALSLSCVALLPACQMGWLDKCSLLTPGWLVDREQCEL
jgi:hypothetical protein